jgi:hypothetical protein
VDEYRLLHCTVHVLQSYCIRLHLSFLESERRHSGDDYDRDRFDPSGIFAALASLLIVIGILVSRYYSAPQSQSFFCL